MRRTIVCIAGLSTALLLFNCSDDSSTESEQNGPGGASGAEDGSGGDDPSEDNHEPAGTGGSSEDEPASGGMGGQGEGTGGAQPGTGGGGTACEPTPEVSWQACQDGVDNDCDGDLDRGEDLGCSVCPPLGQRSAEESTDAACHDGIDNDCDGLLDCSEFGCSAFCAEETDAACSDGVDNDGDGRVDCLGRSCSESLSATVCQPDSLEGSEGTTLLCSNFLDDDGDGRTDCDDAECDGVGYCAPPSGGEDDVSCSDGKDNDGDGRIDCLDNNCGDAAHCQGEGVTAASCEDGLDNDNDGALDCADPDCYLHLAESVCSEEPSILPSLYFSEYVEGPGADKAVEVFNAGETPVDLADCSVLVYPNGNTEATDLPLSGTVASKDVFVLCNSGVSDATNCDASSGALEHNGNDVVALSCLGVVVDVFGTIGESPSVNWVGGGLSSADQSLSRKCSVKEGDRDSSDAFDPSDEYQAGPANVLEDLGTYSCP